MYEAYYEYEVEYDPNDVYLNALHEACFEACFETSRLVSRRTSR